MFISQLKQQAKTQFDLKKQKTEHQKETPSFKFQSQSEVTEATTAKESKESRAANCNPETLKDLNHNFEFMT